MPLRYTTAPSSRLSFSVGAERVLGSAVNVRRNHVVTYFDLPLGPYRMTVASSPSPYPSWAGPDRHALSEKPAEVHDTAGGTPVSRYFQVLPAGRRSTVAACAAGGASPRTAIAGTIARASARRPPHVVARRAGTGRAEVIVGSPSVPLRVSLPSDVRTQGQDARVFALNCPLSARRDGKCCVAHSSDHTECQTRAE